ncbi:hypothetical protein AAE478_006706 [Parahypoxylon ruwenzoriense]
MANLPSQHPHLSLHLADRALAPLITSARTSSHLDALTSLSHGALSAYESASRLGLGTPQRILVEHEHAGPVLLHSAARDNDTGETEPPSAITTQQQQQLQQLQLRTATLDIDDVDDDDDDGTAHTPTNANAPPMLVSVVVAPGADEARDARRAAARLEHVGREVQSRWAEAQQAEQIDGGEEGIGTGGGGVAGGAGD